jgi:hypothetical protein
MNSAEETAVSEEFPVSVLGGAAASHLGILSQLVGTLPNTRYLHLSNEEWLERAKANPVEGMRIYWTEILYRAHFCSLISMVRTKRWVDGLLSMAAAGNYLAFMANYRGFLESSADSYFSLGKVCFWLADFHVVIRHALGNHLDEPTFFPDIENALIHFVHARRLGKGETAPDEHRAKQTKEYIESLAGSPDGLVAECYSHLCNATHPAIASLLCFVNATPPADMKGFGIATDQDYGWIRSFCRDYEEVSSRLMFFGVVPPALTLRILNEFGVAEVTTEAANLIGAERHPIWPDIWARLTDTRLPHERFEPKSI